MELGFKIVEICMRILHVAFILALLFSCKMKGSRDSLIRYQDGRQLLTLNNTSLEGKKTETPVISKISPDSISTGEGVAREDFYKGCQVKHRRSIC